MANHTWPENLPQTPLIDGFSVEYEDNIVRSPTDIGPGKQRARSTLEFATVTCKVWCKNKTQKNDLMRFHTKDLRLGVARFNWSGLSELIALDYKDVQFTKKPSYRASGLGWEFSLELLVFPEGS